MANFAIETRQKNDILFPVPIAPASVAPGTGLQSPPVIPANPSAVPTGIIPLAGNSSAGFGPVQIDGYAVIAVLMISDKPFTATFFEGIIPSGPFGLSQTFVAVAIGSNFVIKQRFSPVGSFMRMTVANTDPSRETFLNLLVQGVPCP